MEQKEAPIRIQQNEDLLVQGKEALLRIQEKEAPPLIIQKKDRERTQVSVASQMVDVEEPTCEVDPFEQA
jgi:P pilus assembly chaperone PapD